MVAEVVVLVVAGVALVAAAKTRLTVTALVPPLTVHSTQLHLGQCDTRSV